MSLIIKKKKQTKRDKKIESETNKCFRLVYRYQNNFRFLVNEISSKIYSFSTQKGNIFIFFVHKFQLLID